MDALVWPIPHRQEAIAFGVRWEALLGSSKPKTVALKVARKQKHTHYVVSGSGERVAIGTARLEKQAKGRVVHSAAAVLARAYVHTSVVARVRLPDDRIWICAAHRGTVVAHTDELLDAPEAADEAIRKLTERFPEIELVGDVSPEAVIDLAQMVDQHRHQSTRLQPASLQWAALPLAVRLALPAASGLLAWQFGYGLYVDYRAEQEAARRQAVRVDATAEWRKAVAGFERRTMVNDAQALHRVWTSLANLQLFPAQWHLVAVECEATAGQWNCSGQYTRASSRTTSAALVRALPSSADLTFQGLNLATATWSVPTETKPLRISSLSERIADGIEYLSALQQVSSAYADITLREAKSVAIPPPRIQHPDGREEVLSRVAGVPSLQAQTFTADGPMRSLATWPETPGLDVKKVSIRLMSGAEPSLKVSAIMATVSGVIYALD